MCLEYFSVGRSIESSFQGEKIVFTRPKSTIIQKRGSETLSNLFVLYRKSECILRCLASKYDIYRYYYSSSEFILRFTVQFQKARLYLLKSYHIVISNYYGVY